MSRSDGRPTVFMYVMPANETKESVFGHRNFPCLSLGSTRDERISNDVPIQNFISSPCLLLVKECV